MAKYLTSITAEDIRDMMKPKRVKVSDKYPTGVKVALAGLRELTPEEAYSWIFHLNDKDSDYIENRGEESGAFKANPIGLATKFREGQKPLRRHRILFKDSFMADLKYLQDADFAILNGLTYFGGHNRLAHASKMFAMIFDIDGVGKTQLKALISQATSENIIGTPAALPLPNLIVASGHGVHLYYIFTHPVDLYPNIKLYAKAVKYALTEKLWNRYTSTEKRVQQQGLNQGFRVIGGKTKMKDVRVAAFALNPELWTLEELASYIPEGKLKIDPKLIYKESIHSLEYAKEHWPEWYASLGTPKKERQKGHWTCNRGLYDWWKERIKESGTYGHRYFCIMALAIYAVKCGISREELEEDAAALRPYLSDLNPQEPFTEEDVQSALECYDIAYVRFPKDDISKITGISMQTTKRNGRTQDVHLYLARRRKEDLKTIGELKKEGRPSEFITVLNWREKHPDGKKIECHRDTGLSRPTINRHWEAAAAIKREPDIKIEPKEDGEPQTMRVVRVNFAEMFNACLKGNK